MAIYHLPIKIISRGKGKSAVAAAAYRSGEKITNEYDGITHDFTRKKGILYTGILLPRNAPWEYSNRSVLWNAVEKIEKQKNAQLAREIEVAIPKELSQGEQLRLVENYCMTNFVSMGMVADICIHNKGDSNPHAHIMLTMRPFDDNKNWGAKSRKEYILDKKGEKIKLKSGEYKSVKVSAVNWNDQDKAEQWRKAWADEVNAFLMRNNIAETIDNRSFKRQGKDELPTIHLGAAAHQMEQRGIATERGNINRNIRINNREIRELKKQLYQIDKWIKEQEENAEPTLAEFINEAMQKRQFRTPDERKLELNKAAQLINFIQRYNIESFEYLHKIVDNMYSRLNDVRQELKTAEQRLKELGIIIEEAGIYQKNKAIYDEYKSIKKPKKRNRFYENNRAEICLYEAAERMVHKHLKAGTLPIKEWKAEHEDLTVKKDGIYRRYYKLKNDVDMITKVKMDVDEIVRRDTLDRASQLENQGQQHRRDRGYSR